MKKDIFSNLIFSDNHNNELTFTKKYLDLKHHDLLAEEESQIDFFRNVIRKYKSDIGYKAKFEVDIFEKVVMEDNRNNKVEIGTDIFGNTTYEEKRNTERLSMKRDLSGNLEFRSGKEQAFLKRDIFNRWSYSDSSGNKFEFSDKTWKRLTQEHVTEEDILYFLVNRFLHF
ncbi:hypothetical protein ACD591_14485 [Rufibacter glacialis]|uniref:Uncharacterized protein n=1 Tax=Rufibacter glacialis TaxID=1259555 RepID=A0ABV4RKS4_9BACT